MLSAIMTKPDFAEVCFLVAFILFVIEFFIRLFVRPYPYEMLLVVAGLAFLALGWLAL
jgi:hypothetical protein